MPVFRVRCSGPEISYEARDALAAAGARWEASESRPDDEIPHHRVVAGAFTEVEAVGVVRDALGSHGTFRDFDVERVTNRHGETVRTPIRTWDDIDWEEVQRKAPLGELHRLVLRALGDAAEPMWTIVQDPDVGGDRKRVEAALRDLERHHLVYSTWEELGEPGDESAMGHWWAITDEGWELLGLIKSPRYR